MKFERIAVRGHRLTLVETVPAALLCEVRMAEAVAPVAEVWGVPLWRLRGRDRSERVSLARFHAYAACRDLGYSLTQIGQFFDRDHTTVGHGLQRLDAARAAAEGRL